MEQDEYILYEPRKIGAGKTRRRNCDFQDLTGAGKDEKPFIDSMIDKFKDFKLKDLFKNKKEKEKTKEKAKQNFKKMTKSIERKKVDDRLEKFFMKEKNLKSLDDKLSKELFKQQQKEEIRKLFKDNKKVRSDVDDLLKDLPKAKKATKTKTPKEPKTKKTLSEGQNRWQNYLKCLRQEHNLTLSQAMIRAKEEKQTPHGYNSEWTIDKPCIAKKSIFKKKTGALL